MFGFCCSNLDSPGSGAHMTLRDVFKPVIYCYKQGFQHDGRYILIEIFNATDKERLDIEVLHKFCVAEIMLRIETFGPEDKIALLENESTSTTTNQQQTHTCYLFVPIFVVEI